MSLSTKGLPNGAFSVILNVDNNPWGAAGASKTYNEIMKEKTGLSDINSAINLAIARVLAIRNQQKNIYKTMNDLFAGSGKTLQNILNESLGNFSPQPQEQTEELKIN